MDWTREAEAYFAGAPRARQPATLSEIWQSSWAASGLDTASGSGQPTIDAFEELAQSVQAATGRSYYELLRDADALDQNLDGKAVALGAAIDGLDEEMRTPLEPLRDFRKRAAEAAAAIERQAADTGAGTYGLSGVATSFLAGLTRAAVDPLNLASIPVGGPLRGPVLKMLTREAGIGAAVQAAQEPLIAENRADLGLEAGIGRSLTNIATAGAGAAGFAGLLRGGAFVLRQGAKLARTPATDKLSTIATPEDLEAVAVRTETEAAIAAQSVPPTPKGRNETTQGIVAAETEIETGRPAPARALQEGPAVLAAPAASIAPTFAEGFRPSRIAYFEGDAQNLIRPDGARLSVRPAVVELGEIRVSHDIDGNANPGYPAELQPRDRSAAPSRAWVAERAARLEPELLGRAPTAQEGAPVVGPDGAVESGNGRALLIGTAYARHPERAAAYRASLEAQGYDLTGFRQPVMVRIREGIVADRALFAREANVAATAGLSVRERAFSDARLLDEQLLSLRRPGETGAAGNALFVRAFADRIVPAEERPQFAGADDQLSAEGARRIEAALVARAWGEEDIVAALYEATEPTSRAILGAFADTAPAAARVKAAIAEGRIPKDADPTGALVEAFRLVERARSSRQKVGDMVDQVDLERGAVPDDVAAAVRLYFRNDALTLAAGRDAVAAKIEKSLFHALDRQNALGDLFGDAPDAAALLRAARHAGEALEDQKLPGSLEDPAPNSIEELLAANASPEEILAHPAIAEAYAAMKAIPSTHEAPGYGTPEFFARREYIFEGQRVVGRSEALARLVAGAKAFAGDQVAHGKVATIVLGPPASGKSTLSERLARASHSAIVDPDEAKLALPEYQGGRGANAVHEESSDLAFGEGGVLDELLTEGANVVIPKVGHNADSIRTIVAALKEEGYRVNLVSLKVGTDTAFRRMVGRYLKTGRLIGSEYLQGIGDKPSKSYYFLKEEGLPDEAIEIDGEAPFGEIRVLDGQDTELAASLGSRRSGEPDADSNAGAAKGEARPSQTLITGDPALRAEAERLLEAAGGDIEVILPDLATGGVRRVSARQVLAEAEEDAAAVQELIACIGAAPKGLAA